VSVDDERVTFPDTLANISTSPSSDAFELRHAIRLLPRGQRNAIELLKLQGLSLKEAAAATGSTIGALKVATHRAMAALRPLLKGTAGS
jgi:DNA-directed RNA polymerase specialized sigma24 family protein